MSKSKIYILTLIAVLVLVSGTKSILAQTEAGSPSDVPLIGITLVPQPLALLNGAGSVTFIYKVTNPGVVPLSNVNVIDNKCSAMSGELGDTNDNHLLDTNEVWIYSCTVNLKQTTTNTATVTALANGLNAVDTGTVTVDVSGTNARTLSPNLSNEGTNLGGVPGLPDFGPTPNTLNLTLIVWGILGGILVVLIIIFFIRKKQ